MLFLAVLWNVVLPVFLVASLGIALQRFVGLNAKALSQATFYVFSPCLAFATLYRLDLHGDGLVDAVVFALTMATLMGGIGFLIARAVGASRPVTSATLLTLINSNTGNYGLPLNQFAFGQAGFQVAILYYVMNATLANSVGVYIASSGRAGVREALGNVARAPLVYATVLALAGNILHVPVPAPVYKAVSLAGQAAVPVMLIILGIHLGRLGTRVDWKRTTPVTLAKLVVGPTMAWFLSAWLGMSGLARAVAIVQASTPTAVMSTVLSTEFDCEPEYVAEIVFVTTVVSIITLTTVVALVKGYVL